MGVKNKDRAGHARFLSYRGSIRPRKRPTLLWEEVHVGYWQQARNRGADRTGQQLEADVYRTVQSAVTTP